MSYGESSTPKGPRGRCIETYEYGGGVMKRRFENKAFDWIRQKDGLEIPLAKDEREGITLYRAADLATAGPERELWFCEGEKDADRLHSLGLLATSAPHGVLGNGQVWRPEFTAVVRKFDRITVLEDNDDHGRAHIREVAGAIHSLGIDVRVVGFPDLPEHGDVSDWLDLGHEVGDLVERSAQAPKWQPPEWPTIIVPTAPRYGPDFPSERLPSPFSDWVETAARACEVPRSLIALPEFGIVGTAGAKKFIVRMNESHSVPVNVWTLTGLDSGERKSSAFRLSLAPVKQWEARRVKASGAEVAEYQAQLRLLKKLRDKAEAAAVSAGGDWTSDEVQEARRLACEYARLESVPVVTPKLVGVDVTPEAAVKIVAEQGHLLFASPEGIIFDHMSGRYSKGEMPNLDFYLMSYSGDDYSSDRVGRESVTADAPLTSMALTTQPSVIAGLGGREGFGDRGILARFWYGLPTPMVGHRTGNKGPIDPAVLARRGGAIESLLDIPKPVATDEARAEPHVLHFESGAHHLMSAFHDESEPRLLPDGDLHGLRAWGSRIMGGTARLAGILHLMEHFTTDPSRIPISEATVGNAIAIMREFLIPNAVVAFGAMRADPATDFAFEMLDALRKMSADEVSQRDLHVVMRHKGVKAKEITYAMGILAEWGVVRNLGRRSTGGRPGGPFFAVNPALLAEWGRS